MPDKNSEELLDLIRRCVEGDECSWAELYRRYNPKLRSWTLRYSSFREDVDDILQDSWCNLMAHHARVLASYVPRPDACFETWLYVVHFRFCVRWFVREAKRRNLLRGDPLDILDMLPAGPCPDPAVLLDLLAAIQRLPVREQAIISLHVAGYSNREIGGMFGTTANNIGVIIHRIRRPLRRGM